MFQEDEFDDRQTETPPTPEESKRPLAIEEEKEPDDSDVGNALRYFLLSLFRDSFLYLYCDVCLCYYVHIAQ